MARTKGIQLKSGLAAIGGCVGIGLMCNLLCLGVAHEIRLVQIWVAVTFGAATAQFIFVGIIAAFMGRTWLSGLCHGLICAYSLVLLPFVLSTGGVLWEALLPLVVLPSAVVAVCLVPWVLRFYFGWRLVSTSDRKIPAQPLGILDLLAVSAVVGVALLLTRAPAVYWSQFDNSRDYLWETIGVFVAAIVFGISVPIAAVIGLGIRRDRTMLFWWIAVVGSLWFVSIVFLGLSFGGAIPVVTLVGLTLHFGIAGGSLGLAMLVLRGADIVLVRGKRTSENDSEQREAYAALARLHRTRDRWRVGGVLLVGFITSIVYAQIEGPQRAKAREKQRLNDLLENSGGFVLKEYGEVVGLVLGEHADGSDLAQFAHFESLESLSLKGVTNVDVAIPSLIKWQGLEMLSLEKTDATDEDVRLLHKTWALEALSLAHTRVTGSCFTGDEIPTVLNALDLSHSKFEVKYLEHLDQLGAISELGLCGIDVTDEDLTNHKDVLANVMTLDLRDTAITGRELSELSSLQRVYLDRSAIKDEDIQKLPPQLSHLTLRGTQITDEGLADLSYELDVLDLGETAITDAGLARATLPSLHTISLAKTNIDGSGLQRWPAKLLNNLDLGDTQVTDDDVQLLTRFRNLAALSLANTQVTDNCIDDLLRLTSLEYLDVTSTSITAAGVAELRRARLTIESSHPPPSMEDEMPWPVTSTAIDDTFGRAPASVVVQRRPPY